MAVRIARLSACGFPLSAADMDALERRAPLQQCDDLGKKINDAEAWMANAS